MSNHHNPGGYLLYKGDSTTQFFWEDPYEPISIVERCPCETWIDLGLARSKERSPNSQLDRLRPSRLEFWWILGMFLRQGFLGMFFGWIFWGRPLEVEFLVGGTCSNPSRQLRHDWFRIESDRGIQSRKRPMKPCMNSTCNILQLERWRRNLLYPDTMIDLPTIMHQTKQFAMVLLLVPACLKGSPFTLPPHTRCFNFFSRQTYLLC